MVVPTTDKEIFLSLAWSYLGTWYKWGGDDPSGFDCSGLVVECAQALGFITGDFAAAALWERWKCFLVGEAKAGCIVFYKNRRGRIVHVEICLTGRLAIGASGGGRAIKTEEDAIEHNAYIKIRPIWGRGPNLQIAGFVDLFDHPDAVSRLGAST